jgi:hypothetical protein
MNQPSPTLLLAALTSLLAAGAANAQRETERLAYRPAEQVIEIDLRDAEAFALFLAPAGDDAESEAPGAALTLPGGALLLAAGKAPSEGTALRLPAAAISETDVRIIICTVDDGLLEKREASMRELVRIAIEKLVVAKIQASARLIPWDRSVRMQVDAALPTGAPRHAMRVLDAGLDDFGLPTVRVLIEPETAGNEPAAGAELHLDHLVGYLPENGPAFPGVILMYAVGTREEAAARHLDFQRLALPIRE